jgi:DNA polymerase-3 subunit alpha (Gram-positive type)
MLHLINAGVEKKTAFYIMESVRKGKGLKPEWEIEMKKYGIQDYYIESCNKIAYLFPKSHATAYVIMA